MRTSADIKNEIAALEIECKAAIAAESEAAIAAAKAFVMTYDYSVTLPHPARFRVERKATAECLARIEAFKAEHPNHAPKPFEGGMTYDVLIGGYVVGSSGAVVVHFPAKGAYTSSFDPIPVSESILSELMAGRCPDEIKRP